MSEWSTGALAGFDLETTSPNPDEARIVTASIVEIGTHRPCDAGWLVNPDIDIPTEASEIHGITTEIARAQGDEPEHALAEICAHLEVIFRQRLPLVIYNAPYDLTVLDRDTRRHGLRPFGDLLDDVTTVIDPLVLDKYVDPYRRGKRTLSAACDHYNVRLDKAHDARADVLGAMRVAWRIFRLHPELAAMPLHDLFSLQREAKSAQSASLQRYFTRIGQPQTVDPSWPWQRFPNFLLNQSKER